MFFDVRILGAAAHCQLLTVTGIVMIVRDLQSWLCAAVMWLTLDVPCEVTIPEDLAGVPQPTRPSNRVLFLIAWQRDLQVILISFCLDQINEGDDALQNWPSGFRLHFTGLYHHLSRGEWVS